MPESAAALLDAHPRIRVVSVDFFDTLVTRKWAQPTHVFADMERALVAADPSMRGFAASRVEAEHRARVRAAADDPHRDVTLGEIHLELARMRNLDLGERTRLAAMERAFEVASARPGGFALEVAREARARGLRVVVVSDNYMPASHLVDMARARDFGSAACNMAQDFDWLRADRPAGFGWMAQDLSPCGAMGDATKACADKGAAVAEHWADAFVALLRDVDRFDLTRLRDA